MAELPPYPGAPRWVKVSGVIAFAVVLLLVILLVTRGPGGHGPRMHAPPGDHGQPGRGHTLPGAGDEHDPFQGEQG